MHCALFYLCLVFIVSSCPIPVKNLPSTHAEFDHQVGTLPPLMVDPDLNSSFLCDVHYLLPLVSLISSEP